MPTSAKSTLDPLKAAAAAAIIDNPELKARVVKLINMMLDDVEEVFFIGDTKDKAFYVRQIVPVLIRSLGEAESTDADDSKREIFDRVMAAVRGEGGPAPPNGGR